MAPRLEAATTEGHDRTEFGETLDRSDGITDGDASADGVIWVLGAHAVDASWFAL